MKPHIVMSMGVWGIKSQHGFMPLAHTVRRIPHALAIFGGFERVLRSIRERM